MLGKLSGSNNNSSSSASKTAGPQPYATLIPSSDHKSAYMAILEYLMRGAWITQLRTFAWVRVSAAVKAAVAREMRVEEAQREAEAAEADSELELGQSATALFSDDEATFDDVPSIELDRENVRERERERKRSSGGSGRAAIPAQSPRLRALLGPPKASSEAGSSSSARTTVRISSGLRVPGARSRNDGGRSSGSRSSQSQRLSDGSSQSRSQNLSQDAGDDAEDSDAADRDEEIKESDFEASLILSPVRADALESRWLKYVGDALPMEEWRSKWPKLVRYFDGKCALEEIALREGWKRKVVGPILQGLMAEREGEGSVLRVVRYW